MLPQYPVFNMLIYVYYTHAVIYQTDLCPEIHVCGSIGEVTLCSVADGYTKAVGAAAGTAEPPTSILSKNLTLFENADKICSCPHYIARLHSPHDT